MPADLQLEALPNGHQANFEEKRRDSARDRRGDYLLEEVLASAQRTKLLQNILKVPQDPGPG
jgi:hypothetical protein